jgi:alpha-1,3-rhamnosyl/mannosyltransferase
LQFGKKGVKRIEKLKIQSLQSFPFVLFWDFLFQKEKKAFKKSVDFFHSTDHLVPIYRDIPVIATVMDTFPISHAKMTKGFFFIRVLKNRLWIETTRKADHIITISEFSKIEIMRDMEIPDSKISVVPLGVDDVYFKMVRKAFFQKTLKKYQLPEHYFLFIGAIQPRKNIEFMLNAHRQVFNASNIHYPLIFIGNDVFKFKYLTDLLEERQKAGELYWLQHLSDPEKRAILQHAKALLLPSIHEGFGLTILEGFASRVPVITSNIPSIIELVKGAAILIDPFMEESLVSAMMKVLKDKVFAGEMITKGEKRAREMTWKNTALKTLAVYKKVLKK